MSKREEMNQRGMSVVLGSYNRKPFLKHTIESIREELDALDVPSEIIVIDGGSTDGTAQWLLRQKDIISIVQHNRGHWRGQNIERRSWGYFMNLGFQSAQGKYTCMVSDDSIIVPGSLKNGYEQFETVLRHGKKVGALAFYWRNWPGNKKYFVVSVNGQPYLNHGMFLTKALEEIGYINEDRYAFYYADIDLALRLVQAGYAIETAPTAFVEHCEHTAAFQARKQEKDRFRPDLEAFEHRWRDFLGGRHCHEATEKIEHPSTPDDAFAGKVFGNAYRLHRLKQSIHFRLKRQLNMFRNAMHF